MNNQSTKISDLPGEEIYDEEEVYGFDDEDEEEVKLVINPKKEGLVQKLTKMLKNEELWYLVILLFIRTLPNVNEFTKKIPFIGEQIGTNNVLLTISSSIIIALIYLIIVRKEVLL